MRYLVVALVMGAFGAITLSSWAQTRPVDRLGPRPQAQPTTRIAPPADFTPERGVSVCKWESERVLVQWLVCGPVANKGDALEKLGGAARARPVPGTKIIVDGVEAAFAEIPAGQVLPEAASGGAGINLAAVIKSPGQACYYYSVLQIDKPALVTASLGAAGRGVEATLWLGGQPVRQGDLVRLEKGLYPMLVEAGVASLPRRRPGVEVSITDARIAPRISEVNEGDLAADLAWRQARWDERARLAAMDTGKGLAAVKFEAKTVAGKEGLFHVGQSVNGRWWFIDPAGRAFYYRGMCALNSGGMGGRRIPNRTDIPDATVVQWLDILKSWGFNALGSWTTPEFFDKGVPYTEIIECWYEGPWITGSEYATAGIPDVFDPAWVKAIDDKCKVLCTPRRDSKLLVGYFLDNERGFAESMRQGVRMDSKSPTREEAGPRAQMPLLQRCLCVDRQKATYKVAWDFVVKRHDGDAGKLARAWGLDAATPEAMAALRDKKLILVSKGYLEDEDAFVRLFVGQYYKVATEAVRRHDPNHLILGVRWGGAPGKAVLEEEAKWTDVVSMNNYSDMMYERMDVLYQTQHKPILVGEYGGATTDYFSVTPMPIEPPGGLSAAQRRQIKGEETIERTFTHPGIVGYTRYKWNGRVPDLDEPLLTIIRANAVAEAVALAWERPPVEPRTPLDGEILLYLHNGVVSRRQFANTEAAEPATLSNSTQLRIALLCRNGQFDKTVYGNGIRGEVVESRTDGARIHLVIKVTLAGGPQEPIKGAGQYSLDLVRDDTKLEGAYTGEFEGEKMSDRALGYVWRPILTHR